MQTVVAIPVVVFAFMLIFQAVMAYHGAHVVTAAAQQGLRTAALEHSTARRGERDAEAFLGRHQRGVLRTSNVTVTRSSSRVRVRVRGEVISLVPGFRPRVTASAEGIVERFRSQAERR